jgi:hypothetical protein
MRKVCYVTAVVIAGISILTGCSSQPTDGRTVTGILVRVGGPAPGSPVPLPGTVVARNVAGGQFTVTTGKNGRFQLSLPLGTYRLTGHSPLMQSDQMLCTAIRAVHVTKTKPIRNIQVVCSIS